MLKINVLTMTYNQHDVIGRAIESVITQRDYGLNKLIIADDKSTDNNWDVISSYAAKYSDCICAYQNPVNMGIYNNLYKLIQNRGDADLYCFLSGDDALCDGWFKAVQDFIKGKAVNLSDSFSIYSDWKFIFPNGKERYRRPEAIGRGLNLFSLYMRGMADGRSVMMGREVINQFKPPLQNKGLNLIESAFDSQKPRFTKQAYYLPYVGSIYYCGIGVSTKLGMNKSDYYTTQLIEKWEYFIEYFINTESDLCYAKFGIEQANYYLNPSFAKLFQSIKFYFKGRLEGVNYDVKDYWNVFMPMLLFPIKKIVKKIIRKK